jgi:hypothetical protein
MKKRYNVEASCAYGSSKFQIEAEETARIHDLYVLDTTSMIFKDIDGNIFIFPRLETVIEMKLLSPTWEKKEDKL